MKNKIGLYVIIVIIFTALVAGASYFAYRYFSDNSAKKPLTASQPLFTAATMPKLDGSTVAIPFMDGVYADCLGVDIKDINYEYSTTQPSYLKLIDKEVDVIIVTEPSADALKYAEKKGVELEVTKIITDGFVFFVNKQNTITSLTIDEIRSIYSGEVTNWSELGGNDAKIIAYQRPINSGSQTGMLSLVMKELKMKKPKTEEVIETMVGIIDWVSNYTGEAHGIGYSYYYYANDMYISDDIKFLAINNILPNFETIQTETYPLMTAYYMVSRKGETDPNVNKLKEVILSEHGKEIAVATGYIPVK